jgi:hypothetical protein
MISEKKFQLIFYNNIVGKVWIDYIKLFYRASILLLQDSWIINPLGPAKSNLARKDVTILDNALK